MTEDELIVLAAVPGLDAAAGLRGVGGQMAFYQRLLRTYAGSHATDVAALRELMAAGDHQTATRLAHTLKGVSATLGATLVRSRSEVLEKALKERRPQPELDDALAALDHALSALLDGLDAHLIAPPGVAVAPDPQRLQAVLSELIGFLAEDDSRTPAFVANNTALLDAALGDAANDLIRLINAFEFEEALVLLNALLAARPGLGRG